MSESRDAVRDKTFAYLTMRLRDFRMKVAPRNEADIEKALAQFLASERFEVKRQVANKWGRYDVLVIMKQNYCNLRFCIEVKRHANVQCTMQLDKYGPHVDGLVMVCWQASNNLRAIFDENKKTALIPVELCEVRKNGRYV